jgi:hypothetical protein
LMTCRLSIADEPDVSVVVSSFITSYRAGHFLDAAALLHCPPSYTEGEVDEDRQGVASSLRILSSLYGPIRSIAPPTSVSAWLGPTTACGTAEYWESIPAEITRVLEANPGETDRSFLIFHFCSYEGEVVLCHFGHGLAATHPEVRLRLQRFLELKEKTRSSSLPMELEPCENGRCPEEEPRDPRL